MVVMVQSRIGVFAHLCSAALYNQLIVRLSSTSTAKQLRRYTSASQDFDFSHIVVGGGVVGLAIARQIQIANFGSFGHDRNRVLLLEKNEEIGMETSSRNSEVIHAGIYYPPQSLKSLLCRRGRDLLYQFCEDNEIPHQKCGKWIVAQNDEELEHVQRLHQTLLDGNSGILEQANEQGKQHRLASFIPVAPFPPTHFLSSDEAKLLEVDVKASAGVLVSPDTGIIDSNSLMRQLRTEFENAGGLCVMNSRLSKASAVEPDSSMKAKDWIAGEAGWAVEVQDRASTQTVCITTPVLINAAGHGAPEISNSILPPDRRVSPLFVKGSYYKYSASSPRPTRLIYPVPLNRAGSGPAAGLGTHLTLDLAGRVRFGPDIEWTDSNQDINVGESITLDSNGKYTRKHHSRMAAALVAIQTYLPTVRMEEINVDYAGVRPKLASGSALFRGVPDSPGDTGPLSVPQPFYPDFYIAIEDGFVGFVNLMGIESPGLTSALAIGEMINNALNLTRP